MRKLLCFLLVTILIRPLAAQEFCGTPSLEEMKELGIYTEPSSSTERKSGEDHDEDDGEEDTYVRIPVLIYIWNNSSITIGEVQNQLDLLNNEVAAVSHYTDFDMEFCIATTQDGAPLPTPISPSVSAVYQYSDRGLFWIEDRQFSPSGTIPHMGVAPSTSWNYFNNTIQNLNEDRYLRIFIGPVEGGGSFSTILPPYMVSFPHKFIALSMEHTLNNDIEPALNEGKVLVHEIGHYFGLFHVFDSGCNYSGSSYVCGADGDKICDTPPVTAPSQGFSVTDCSLWNSDKCSFYTNYPANRDNHMDYVGDPCRVRFTEQQCDIMQHTFSSSHDEHYDLWQPANLGYTQPDCSPLQPDQELVIVFEEGDNERKAANVHTGGFDISLYPVPVHDELNLNIRSSTEESVNIVLTDIYGKVLQKEEHELKTGENELTLNVQELMSGAYHVEVIRVNGEQQTLRFVK